MNQRPAPPQVPFWRSPQGRAWTFQIAMLAAFLWLVATAYSNVLANLENRGISSGFKFLRNEAGFRIGETMGVPLPGWGVFLILAALAAGLAASRLLARRARSTPGPRGDAWFAAGVVACAGLPALALWLTRDAVDVAHYSETSSYGLALAVGLLNTLKVTLIGCVASTFLGLLVALGRLSPNWLLRTLCRWYVELNRNLPVLLQLFFWYFIVLQHLPDVRNSLSLGEWAFLNKRGLYVPALIPLDGAWAFCAAALAALAGAVVLRRRSRRLREETGAPGRWILPGICLLLALPALSWLAAGQPFALELPALKGFNFQGGTGLSPEFTALVVGLTVYVSAFNAEIIRSGIQAVPKGQREAARALAMGEGQVLRLVVLPQAMRVIVPPMTSEYLAIAKSSSLAVAIGYPDFVSVGGTVLNQSGQSIEVVGIWMGVYLAISLVISLGMNLYNRKVALVER